MVDYEQKEEKDDDPENGEIEYDAIIKLHGSVKWKLVKILGFFSFWVSAIAVIVSVILKLLGVGAP